ncbi:hypothetical protein KDRO_A06670 [Kluyveromyces lactis]|nr:hypothetical protein KDRO_A06670 [Kluyveromyces lactis]
MKSESDIQPDEHLPSYDEVLRQDTAAASQQQQQLPPNPPPRPTQPPAKPPRPSNAIPAYHRPTSTFSSSTSTSTGNKKLPWTYPPGYYCKKCGNTGTKIKTQQKCKKCWSKFYKPPPAQPPRPSAGPRPAFVYSNVTMPPQNFVMNSAPIVVRPGDSRIGGMMCNNCNGTGRVRFFLDKEPCPVCYGLGRILTGPTY